VSKRLLFLLAGWGLSRFGRRLCRDGPPLAVVGLGRACARRRAADELHSIHALARRRGNLSRRRREPEPGSRRSWRSRFFTPFDRRSSRCKLNFFTRTGKNRSARNLRRRARFLRGRRRGHMAVLGQRLPRQDLEGMGPSCFRPGRKLTLDAPVLAETVPSPAPPPPASRIKAAVLDPLATRRSALRDCPSTFACLRRRARGPEWTRPGGPGRLLSASGVRGRVDSSRSRSGRGLDWR
jgi:hypothetical protein